MINKWVVFIFSIFLVYSITKSPDKILTPIKTEEITPENLKFMEQIKSYSDILTKESQNNLNENKNTPIVAQEDKKKASDSTNENLQPNEELTTTLTDKKYQKLEGQVYNFIYNILHTKQGQDLLEKVLTNPTKDEKSQKINEVSPYQNNSIMNILEGDGEKARCGDLVTAHFITRLVNGQTIEDTNEKNTPKIFTIGNQDVIRGIEFAAIGMKKGGHRRLVTLPKYAYNLEKFSKSLVAQNEFITIDINLVDIKQSQSELENIKIFQAQEQNNGTFMLCGDRVYFNYILKDSKENIIAKSSSPVNFILGSKEVPQVFSRAFEGIKSRSQRTVIFSSSLLSKQKIKFLPSDINIPSKETLIMEINTDVGPIK